MHRRNEVQTLGVKDLNLTSKSKRENDREKEKKKNPSENDTGPCHLVEPFWCGVFSFLILHQNAKEHATSSLQHCKRFRSALLA